MILYLSGMMNSMFKDGTGGCGGRSSPSRGTGGRRGCAAVFLLFLSYT